MPLPLAVVPILAAIAPWVTRFFLAKGVLMLAGFMGRLGLVLATNELLIEPIIQHITGMWTSIPAGFQCWLGAFGAIKVASIMVSAMTLLAAKQIFLSKSA